MKILIEVRKPDEEYYCAEENGIVVGLDDPPRECEVKVQYGCTTLFIQKQDLERLVRAFDKEPA